MRRFTRWLSDPFAGDPVALDPMNMSHVRVAGLGGLGLVLVAVGVAFQFRLVGVSLALGLAGGMMGGLALIWYRRHRLGARGGARPPL
jgi:hypothetical protein